MVVNDKGEIDGTVGGGAVEHECIKEAQKAISEGRCLTLEFNLNEDEQIVEKESSGICGGSVRIFIEPFRPREEVVMFGGGHIAEKLAAYCNTLNLPFRVYDDREEFTNRERFPNAKELVCAEFNRISENIKLSAMSYCVIMTYGHVHDETCLEQLIGVSEVPYIGMMGSVEKVTAVKANLKKRGVELDKRVYSPIGLKIGSNLPEEIALSIIAEIQCVLYGGKPEHFRLSE